MLEELFVASLSCTIPFALVLASGIVFLVAVILPSVWLTLSINATALPEAAGAVKSKPAIAVEIAESA